MTKQGIAIGIGGISRSGKSFLAKELSLRIKQSDRKVKVLDQDDFVFPEDKIPMIRDHIDWEIPESIDFRKLGESVSQSVLENDVVIAEGLMIFWDTGIFNLLDYKIFIKLERDEFISRKQTDLRWGKEPDWYIDHIWNGYIKYGQYPKGLRPDLVLSGNEMFDLNGIFDRIFMP